MAVEKNIKEVTVTEADFIANAADKNDGFLTDDTDGYCMVRKRGTNVDYWYPIKTRDNLGVVTWNPLPLGNGFTLVSSGTDLQIYIDGAPAGIVLAVR